MKIHSPAGLLMLLLCAGSSLGADSPVPIPDRTAILSTLRPEHPRLFANAAEFARLKERIASDNTLRQWHAKLLERADKMLEEEPAKYEIPDGLRLLAVSRSIIGRLQTLGLLYQTTGKPAYAERAWKELQAAAAFPDWNPRHFLDTAEMAHAFAIGYDWLYHAWTPEQRTLIREALVQKALLPAQGVYNGTAKYSAFHKVRHNWNQVCNGGIGIGALAIADEVPELAGELLNRAASTIQLAMREYGPDGAWAEGPGYWNYATTYNVAFLAALESALGADFGLSQIAGFEHAGDFPIHLTGPLGRTFNYADGGDGTIRSPSMYWLARKFGRPDYTAYQTRVAAGQPMDLIWHEAISKTEPATPLDTYFRGAEVATMRSAWNDRDAMFVGFKAGDNKANHSNLDLGTFVLDALGVRWVLDLGADDYNLPGYFGKGRWNYYRMRAEGHNTIVVNPSAEPDQLPSAAAGIERFRSETNRAFAVADLSPAYDKKAQIRRGVALLDRRQVLVQDEILCPNAAELWWFLHTAARIEIGENGASALLRQDGKQLNLAILSPKGAVFTVRKAEPLPGSAQPEKQNANEGIRKLAIHLPGTLEVRIAVLLTPMLDQAKSDRPEIVPLAGW